LEKIRREADDILKEIRDREQTSKYHEALQKASKLKTMNEAEIRPDESLANTVYLVGDAVELRSSSTVCQILKIEKKEILILINGREMRVRKDQIRPSSHVIPKMKPEISVQVKEQNIFASIPSEVNLIGMHADEALEALENYMDTAKIHGLKTFRVIHGDGTGRLRKTVHEHLTKDPDVKSFRLGMQMKAGPVQR
jgi:DNA mismatch repair protein MutS2